MIRPFPLVALAISTIASATQVGAAKPERPASLFENKTFVARGRSVGVNPKSVDRLPLSDPLRRGWDGFRSEHADEWEVYIDERTALPTLAFGKGVTWFPEDGATSPSADALETKAREFLAAWRELLGDWDSALWLDAEASGTLRPGHQQIVFRQVVDGVRVENARLDLHVVRGRLVMFGATHWGVPAIGGVPALDAGAARRVLDDRLEIAPYELLPVAEPELVMIAVDAEAATFEPRAWNGPRGAGLGHRLIWRFRLQEPGAAPLWIGEVDAHHGEVVGFYDGTSYAGVRGGVFPASADGDCADGGCEIARFPMPFADYTETGQVETFADAFGNLQCVDGAASFDVGLSGPYVHIEDTCGPIDETGTCTDGLDMGMKNGENCDVEDGASPGNSAAARTTFYHINRAAEVARFYDPGNTWLQTPLTVRVNVESTCNAFWSGIITMYHAGNGCGNMGELQGVLAHEWGHGLDDNDGGGMDKPGEGYADIVAMFAGRDSCLSRGWYVDGSTCVGWGNPCLTCTGVRDIDWAARAWNTPATASNFMLTQCPPEFSPFAGPCMRQPHCEGHVIGETMYDFATRDLPAAGLGPDTAWQLAERLWYVTRPGSGGNMYFCILPNTSSCGATSLFQRLRVADDDDGDLSNGTPHAAALYAAFARHDLACGAPDAPENLSTSSCPALAAPVLSVAETPGGTELSWNAVAGAGEYRVYRGDLGCDRQQVPIASLTGGETTLLDTVADPELPRYYRVEVLGTNPACSSPVSNCASTPAGGRLQKNSHRIVEPGPDINGIPDPGETVQLPVTLFNSGSHDAVGVQATLSFVDPAQGTALDAVADWLDLVPGTEQESTAPHFQIEVAETVSCGDLLTLDLEMSAATAPTTTRRFGIQLGEPDRDFINETSEVIPLETAVPVTSTIDVDQDLTIAELDVTVDISHGEDTEVIVELTSPQATTVRLHDRTSTPGFGIRRRYDLDVPPDGPGTMDDFAGESTLGTWTLSIEDVGSASIGDGSLNDWTLHFVVNEAWDCVPAGCDDPVPTEAPDLRVDRVWNGAEYELVFSWNAVPLASGYHVLESTVAPLDVSAELIGATDAATTSLSVLDSPGGADLTFFEARAVNSCQEEGP